MDESRPVRVLFVCLGNICRSPLAEGVFRKLVKERRLDSAIEVSSVGTGNWHVGEPPDRRMYAVAQSHGVSLDGKVARQLRESDLENYTHIFAMDKANLHDTLYLDTRDRFGHKVRLFREMDPEPDDYQVPDPYYGGPNGFEEVYEIVDRTCSSILNRLTQDLNLAAPK